MSSINNNDYDYTEREKKVLELYDQGKSVATNQVQSQPDNSFGGSGSDSIRASGGNIMGHACTYRIFLRKAGHDRIAIMVDSPHHIGDYAQVHDLALPEG